MYDQYKLNACKRCSGSLLRRFDQYGDYYSCIQCGSHFEIVADPVADEEMRVGFENERKPWVRRKWEKHR